MNLEYKQEKKIIFKLHLHSILSFRLPAKPLFMSFSAIFHATQTRQLQRCNQTYLFSFYLFSAVILSLLHILFGLADFLLPICCHKYIIPIFLYCVNISRHLYKSHNHQCYLALCMRSLYMYYNH